MKIIVKGRGGGKTRLLLEQMNEDPTMVMVCIHERAANDAWFRSIQMRMTHDLDPSDGVFDGLERNRFIPVQKYVSMPQHWKRQHSVAADNLDLIMEILLGVPVTVASITKEGK